MGFFGVACQRDTVVVAGRELPGLRVWGSLNGLTLYELLAVEKAGDCMFVIMAESTYEAGCRELMDCWYALD